MLLLLFARSSSFMFICSIFAFSNYVVLPLYYHFSTCLTFICLCQRPGWIRWPNFCRGVKIWIAALRNAGDCFRRPGDDSETWKSRWRGRWGTRGWAEESPGWGKETWEGWKVLSGHLEEHRRGEKKLEKVLARKGRGKVHIVCSLLIPHKF